MSSRWHNQIGSTLMESLVAVALFSIGSAAVAQLLTQHTHFETANGTATYAIGLAEHEMEDMRASPYASMVSRSTTSVVNSISYVVATTVAPESPAPNLKTITTVVSWSDNGQSKTYTLYAIYHEITT